MMFRATGHKNLKATHKTTLEFTKENFLTPNGTCIIGINADFDSSELKKFVRSHKKVKITIQTGDLKEVIHASTNPNFSDSKELVIRLGHFDSPRTFATGADKSAKYLNRELINALKLGSPMEVKIEAAE